MNARGFQRFDANVLPRHGASPPVGAPNDEVGGNVTRLIAFDRFGRHVEDASFLQRPQQLDVFGVRPDQRHGGTGGAATEQLALGDVVTVPNLFRQEAGGTWLSNCWT